MTDKTYPIAPARIGNAAGFRLPASFYRDRPQFVNASGWVSRSHHHFLARTARLDLLLSKICRTNIQKSHLLE